MGTKISFLLPLMIIIIVLKIIIKAIWIKPKPMWRKIRINDYNNNNNNLNNKKMMKIIIKTKKSKQITMTTIIITTWIIINHNNINKNKSQKWTNTKTSRPKGWTRDKSMIHEKLSNKRNG